MPTKAPPAFCEDFDSDLSDTVPNSRVEANAVTKRTQSGPVARNIVVPESLAPVKPFSAARSEAASDSGYSSRTASTRTSASSRGSDTGVSDYARANSRRGRRPPQAPIVISSRSPENNGSRSRRGRAGLETSRSEQPPVVKRDTVSGNYEDTPFQRQRRPQPSPILIQDRGYSYTGRGPPSPNAVGHPNRYSGVYGQSPAVVQPEPPQRRRSTSTARRPLSYHYGMQPGMAEAYFMQMQQSNYANAIHNARAPPLSQSADPLQSPIQHPSRPNPIIIQDQAHTYGDFADEEYVSETSSEDSDDDMRRQNDRFDTPPSIHVSGRGRPYHTYPPRDMAMLVGKTRYRPTTSSGRHSKSPKRAPGFDANRDRSLSKPKRERPSRTSASHTSHVSTNPSGSSINDEGHSNPNYVESQSPSELSPRSLSPEPNIKPQDISDEIAMFVAPTNVGRSATGSMPRNGTPDLEESPLTGSESRKEERELKKLIPESLQALAPYVSGSPSESSDSCQVSSLASWDGLPSTTTSHTQYSQEHIRSASQVLTDIFWSDRDLRPMYDEALENPKIGLRRFCRNFRRLLQGLSQSLKEEATEHLEMDTANLIWIRARAVADTICEKLNVCQAAGSQQSTKPGESREELLDDSSDDDDLTIDPEDFHVTLMQQGRDFILSSKALEAFKKDLRLFIRPIRDDANEQLENLTNDHVASQNELPAEEAELKPQMEQANIVEWAPLSPQVHRASYLASMAKSRTPMLRHVQQALAALKLVEEPLEAGFRRVRWKCACGKYLYDDYQEYETGSLDVLEEILNHSHPRRAGTTQSAGPETPGQTNQAMEATDSPTSSSMSHSDTSSQTYVPSASGSPSQTTSQYLNADVELQRPGETRASRLMCCMEEGRFALNLYQEVLDSICDDVKLFRFLRKTYQDRRGRLRQYWSLRGLNQIKLIRFSYGGPRWVDLRKHENDCVMNQRCECLPPKTLVGTEYQCEPVPPKYSPPIGPRLMRHLYDHPNDAGIDSIRILSQLPKRICGELRAKNHEQVEAWGIVYEEGWNWPRIWVAMGLVFFAPSLVFGVLWGVLKHDIQGAFGVASWWMIGATILLGITGTSEQLY